MNKYLIPDLMVESIYDIDIEDLKRRNIRGLLFDIDNTLAPFGSLKPTKDASKWMSKLREEGFLLGIISNARDERAEGYKKECEMFYTGNAAKPSVRGYVRTASEMGLLPREIAVVGDQIFTDIKGGNRFGAYTVLVSPVDLKSEPWYTRIKRPFERIILRRIAENGSRKRNG